jgi:hypothetical protein
VPARLPLWNKSVQSRKSSSIVLPARFSFSPRSGVPSPAATIKWTTLGAGR